jgi:hypothetical protein
MRWGKYKFMKTRIVFGLALLSMVLLASCGGTGREKKLQAHADSLAISNKEARAMLHEVSVLLDAIDQKRAALRVNTVEGNSRQNYSTRLKNINRYVNKTEKEIARLEKVVKKSTLAKASYMAAIHRLKTELEDANKQLVLLRDEGIILRNRDSIMVSQIVERDSLIAERERFIKIKEDELLAKEELARKIDEESLEDFANLYYAQANALEMVANRTRLAPHKKKETRREALELYKISASLGKVEAEGRITKLEKQIGVSPVHQTQNTTVKIERY